MKAEEVERKKRKQEKLTQETRLLKEKGESLDRKDQDTMEEMQTADELLSEGTVKLQTGLFSGSKLDSKVDSQGVKVACLMWETAKSNQAKARKLEAVREKQKVFVCVCSAIKEKKVKLKDEQSFYNTRCSLGFAFCNIILNKVIC